MPSIKPFDITLSVINLLLYQMREAITIVHHDSQGRPICDHYDSLGASHGFGLFARSIHSLLTRLCTCRATTAPEASGFRIPTGFRQLTGDCARCRAATTTWLARPVPFAPGTYTQMSL